MENREGVVMENENARIELDFSVGKQGEMGPQGPQGPQGEPGANGADGKSAYQVAVDNGFEGSEAEWLESLKGKDAEGGTLVSANAIEVTQEDLFRLRDNSLLIVGQEYKVIDYVSHYDEYNATSAKHPYDLTVRANGVSSWCENAKASIHEGDTYFAQNDLTKWELKVDNNLKVVWLKDEYENEAPFDFKNVLWEGYFYTFSLLSTEGTISDCSLVQYKCYRNRLMHKVNITDIANKQIFLILTSTQQQNSIGDNYIVREEFNNINILGAEIFNNIILGGIINIMTMMGSIDNNTFIDSRVVVNSQIQDEGINFEYSTVIDSALVIPGGLLKTTIVSSNVRVMAQNIDTYTLKVYGNNTTYDLNYTNNPDMPTTGDVFLKPDGSAWVGDKVQWYEKYYREKENQWVEVTDFTKPFLVEGVRNYCVKFLTLPASDSEKWQSVSDVIGAITTEDILSRDKITITFYHASGGTNMERLLSFFMDKYGEFTATEDIYWGSLFKNGDYDNLDSGTVVFELTQNGCYVTAYKLHQ